MNESRDNEFGDENNLEIGPKWAELFFYDVVITLSSLKYH